MNALAVQVIWTKATVDDCRVNMYLPQKNQIDQSDINPLLKHLMRQLTGGSFLQIEGQMVIQTIVELLLRADGKAQEWQLIADIFTSLYGDVVVGITLEQTGKFRWDLIHNNTIRDAKGLSAADKKEMKAFDRNASYDISASFYNQKRIRWYQTKSA